MRKRWLTMFLFSSCYLPAVSMAQVSGQLLIPSVDDTVNIVYVCDGGIINAVRPRFILINTMDSAIPHLFVDSLTFEGDSTKFENIETLFPGDIGPGDFMVAFSYQSSVPSNDTIVIKGYYGPYVSEGKMIMHTRLAPAVSLYGIVTLDLDFGGGYKTGESNYALITDTLHKDLGFVTVGSSPGTFKGDTSVIVRSCDQTTIDSLYTVGDFSEISFSYLPSIPFLIQGNDSLKIPYHIVAQHVGSFPHYLVFHTVSGKYLVWSFEYYVEPSSSANTVSVSNTKLLFFPNPATNDLQILGGPSGTARLFDLLGRERAEARDDGAGVTLDISHIEAGAYFLRIGNQSAKVEIAH